MLTWIPAAQSLIDLAGSEKATSDKLRSAEGKFINTSLLALKQVVSTIAKNELKKEKCVLTTAVPIQTPTADPLPFAPSPARTSLTATRSSPACCSPRCRATRRSASSAR